MSFCCSNPKLRHSREKSDLSHLTIPCPGLWCLPSRGRAPLPWSWRSASQAVTYREPRLWVALSLAPVIGLPSEKITVPRSRSRQKAGAHAWSPRLDDAEDGSTRLLRLFTNNSATPTVQQHVPPRDPATAAQSAISLLADHLDLDRPSVCFAHRANDALRSTSLAGLQAPGPQAHHHTQPTGTTPSRDTARRHSDAIVQATSKLQRREAPH